jgi:hypothetical protein
LGRLMRCSTCRSVNCRCRRACRRMSPSAGSASRASWVGQLLETDRLHYGPVQRGDLERQPRPDLQR